MTTARADSEAPSYVDGHRHPLAFLRHPWFHWLLALWMPGIAAAAVYLTTKNFVAYAFAIGLISAGGAVSFGVFVAGRLRLTDALAAPITVLIGVASALVGLPVALLAERAIGKAFTPYLTGPIEESAILLVPVLIAVFRRGRFVRARAGLAMVLASAATFAALEAVVDAVGMTYKLHDSARTVILADLHQSLLGAFAHMCISGLAAAIVWREWERRGRPVLTLTVAGGVASAMALHSVNDVFSVVLAPKNPIWSFCSTVVVVATYLLFKHAAAKLLPPEDADRVPRSWRPHPPHRVGTRSPGLSARPV